MCATCHDAAFASRLRKTCKHVKSGVDLAYGFVRNLGIFAGITSERGGIVDYIKSGEMRRE